MKRFLLIISIIIPLSFQCFCVDAQTQTVANGSPTTAVNFPGSECLYKWVNNNPGIGLAASGTGNIPSFTAINKSTVPVIATITATPVHTGFAYITNDITNGTVSVIDTATRAIVTTIPVGSKPVGVAVSPDGGHVYVTNSSSNTFTVINTTTNVAEATFPAGQYPYGIAVSPDGSLLYVANTTVDNLSIINATTGTLVATIPVGGEPTGVAISPDGTSVYVANNSGNSVSAINTSTDLVIATIPVGARPYGITVSADGSHLYVANEATNNVSDVNILTNTIDNITVGQGPFGIALSADGGELYVTNSGTGTAGGSPPPGTVSVINTVTDLVTATIGVGLGPSGISFSPDGNRVYVVNNFDNTVSVINRANNQLIATTPVGMLPSSLGSFIAGGAACGNTPITFTITVTPKILTPAITADTAAGIISACAGMASMSPNIQQFTVSGANLTGNLTVTAAAGSGFEVSLASGSGYSNSMTLNQSGGAVSSTTVYVRAAATAPIGSITSNITISSAGATDWEVTVAALIKAVPAINAVGNQTVDNGRRTAAINFTGTTNTYNWTNDTPGIGLSASGNGNIAPFTAINNGSTPVTATITVTPLPNPKRFAYIANEDSNTISVINTAINQVTAIIPVGMGPKDVSVSPDGSRVYVANEQDNTVSVINAATNLVTAVIPVGSEPSGMCVSPDGSKLYVCNSINVSVINTANNTIMATIVVGEYPNQLAISPDGSRLYVTNSGNNDNNGSSNSDFYTINTNTNTIISTILLGEFSNGVAISPDGSRVYVANTFSNNVSVIDAATNVVLDTIPVGIGPWGICISPDGSYIYVTDSGDQSTQPLAPGAVSVISAASKTVIATIPVDTYPIGISITGDGSEVYVANDFGKSPAGSGQTFPGTVSVINTANNTVKATVYVGYNAISRGNFISNGTGCAGMPITFTITVDPAAPVITPGNIVIPNTFTPNGDGINDTWDIKNLSSYPNCTVEIFNRYGENIYTSNGYGTPWNGTYKGVALPTSTYYYIINLKNGSKVFSGFVAIIR